MPIQHIWTDRNQDGRKREVRATKFGGAWRVQAKMAGDLDWTYYDRPLLEDLLTLKEILVRKYQRRRASVEDVASIETLIQEQRGYECLMSEWNTKALIEADKRFVWHPFTNMREWCAAEHEPLILVEGQGAVLRDSI